MDGRIMENLQFDRVKGQVRGPFFSSILILTSTILMWEVSSF